MMPPEEKNDSEDAFRFINELSKATQIYGLSTTDTWARIINLARALGWNVRFIATPNHVQLVFWQDDDDTQYIRFITTKSGDYDLAKMAEIRKLMDLVETRQVIAGDAIQRLREIINAPSIYHPLTNGMAYVLCGLGFAAMLGVSWVSLVFGGILSLISFTTAAWANRSQAAAILIEFLAAMISAIAASMIASQIPGIDPISVTICSVIFFVPGFGLTIAPHELIKGNTLSGVIWFTNASVTMLKLIGGMIVGFALVQQLLPVRQLEPGKGISHEWAWIFVPLLVTGLAILFRVPKRQLVWPLIGSLIVWAGIHIGNTFGFWQGTFLGSVALMLFAYAANRLIHISASAIYLPGIMVLVPGVATLKALYAFQTEDMAAGFHSLSGVIVLIAAILGGVMVGSSIFSSATSTVSYWSKRYRK